MPRDKSREFAVSEGRSAEEALAESLSATGDAVS
jgi:hypothetical protein